MLKTEIEIIRAESRREGAKQLAPWLAMSLCFLAACYLDSMWPVVAFLPVYIAIDYPYQRAIMDAKQAYIDDPSDED